MKKIIYLSLILLLLPISVKAQSNEDMIKQLLESFCREYYSDCFSGRTYVKNTIDIDDISVKDGDVIKVTGTHAYRGSYGSLYEDMDFYVYITMTSYKIKFEFYKKAKADFFHSTDYWEECDKTITKD